MPLNRNIFNKSLYARVRDIWFAGLSRDATVPPEHLLKDKWFVRDESQRIAFDDICKEEFGDALIEIGPDKDKGVIAKDLVQEIENETSTEECAENALSIVILLDQIPRNRYREKDTLPYVYNHYDFIARDVVKHVLTRPSRLDHVSFIRYSAARRMWFYMPLMHSEDRADHEKFMSLVTEISEDVKAKGDQKSVDYVTNMRDFEIQHKEIVDRFGRYPYRNTILGRTSTEEELEWLETGETFGVSG